METVKIKLINYPNELFWQPGCEDANENDDPTKGNELADLEIPFEG